MALRLSRDFNRSLVHEFSYKSRGLLCNARHCHSHGHAFLRFRWKSDANLRISFIPVFDGGGGGGEGVRTPHAVAERERGGVRLLFEITGAHAI
jgi:hypothetical protein